MNASGWTGPPTCTASSAPGIPASDGTASTAATSEGRVSTSPIAPSSSWWAISTTVRRKCGSRSDGADTSSCPWSESMAVNCRLRPARNPGELRERPAVAVGERLEDAPRDHHPMHLVGAVVDAAAAGELRHLRQRGLIGEAERAVHLDRPVDDVAEDA